MAALYQLPRPGVRVMITGSLSHPRGTRLTHSFATGNFDDVPPDFDHNHQIMTFFDFDSPLVVTPSVLNAGLQVFFRAEDVGPLSPTLYFPRQALLRKLGSPLELTIPWETNFTGLRISDFNGTGLRLLTREGGRVTWSQALGPGDLGVIVDAFLETVESTLTGLSWGFPGLLPDEFACSLGDCERLLRGSFRDEIKPRLIPPIAWPSPEDELRILRENLPALPWVLEDYNGRRQLVKEGDCYRFEIFGERGEREFHFQSPNLDEVGTVMLERIFRRSELADDRRYQFNWVMLPKAF